MRFLILVLTYCFAFAAMADEKTLLDLVHRSGVPLPSLTSSERSLVGFSDSAPLTSYLGEFPLRGEEVAKSIERYIGNKDDSITSIYRKAILLGGRSVRIDDENDLVSDWLTKSSTAAGRSSVFNSAKLNCSNKLDSIPASIRQAIALYIQSIQFAIGSISPVIKSIDESRVATSTLHYEETHLINSPKDYENLRYIKRTLKDFKTEEFDFAALRILLAIEKSRSFLSSALKVTSMLRCSSVLGEIIIGSSGNDDYTGIRAPAIIIEPGGNDIYANAGSASPSALRASISIDLSGNDKYVSNSKVIPSFGSGILGIGILVDESGEDTYQGLSQTIASAVGGVGIVIDNSGNDSYSAIIEGVGSARGGTALLYDKAGHDTYNITTYGGGYGGTNGTALLWEGEGDDKYSSSNEKIIYPSSQDSNSNISFTFGTAAGYRGDFDDGVSTSGGTGLFLDLSGDDRLICSVFCAGASFWGGFASYLDLSGNDSREAHWYAFAAAAHGAGALFFDKSGNDATTSTLSSSLGIGHDLGVAFFQDSQGQDYYSVPKLSLGTGSAGGFGIFVDSEGLNSYLLNSQELRGWIVQSRSDDIRQLIPAFALFHSD